MQNRKKEVHSELMLGGGFPSITGYGMVQRCGMDKAA